MVNQWSISLILNDNLYIIKDRPAVIYEVVNVSKYITHDSAKNLYQSSNRIKKLFIVCPHP